MPFLEFGDHTFCIVWVSQVVNGLSHSLQSALVLCFKHAMIFFFNFKATVAIYRTDILVIKLGSRFPWLPISFHNVTFWKYRKSKFKMALSLCRNCLLICAEICPYPSYKEHDRQYLRGFLRHCPLPVFHCRDSPQCSTLYSSSPCPVCGQHSLTHSLGGSDALLGTAPTSLST